MQQGKGPTGQIAGLEPVANLAGGRRLRRQPGFGGRPPPVRLFEHLVEPLKAMAIARVAPGRVNVIGEARVIADAKPRARQRAQQAAAVAGLQVIDPVKRHFPEPDRLPQGLGQAPALGRFYVEVFVPGKQAGIGWRGQQPYPGPLM